MYCRECETIITDKPVTMHENCLQKLKDEIAELLSLLAEVKVITMQIENEFAKYVAGNSGAASA